MVNVHNVIVFLEFFDEKIHKLDVIFTLESNGCGCLLGLICGENLIAGSSEVFLNVENVVGLSGDDKNVTLCLVLAPSVYPHQRRHPRY